MKIYDLTLAGIYNARQNSYDCHLVAVLFRDGGKAIEQVSSMEDEYSLLEWPDYDPDCIAVRGANRKEVRRFLAEEEHKRRWELATEPFYTADEMEVIFS